MSLLPLVRELMWDECNHPVDLSDQHFGLSLLDDDILRPVNAILRSPMRCGYLRPWRLLEMADSGISSIQSNKNEFRVNLDVQQFKPEELKVKVEDDGYLVVEGRHEERSDQHGLISRQFTRKYKIPEDVDPGSIASSLSSDGVLSLKAPKKNVPELEGREIPIEKTNKPALKAKGAKEQRMEKMEQ